jgi:hypothetical protein
MFLAWFGTRQNLHHLIPVNIKSDKGEDLCLSFRTSISYFIFPLLFSRETDNQVAQWQKTGHLPNPLPPYHTKFGDYWPVIFGWALLIIGVIGYYFGK